MLRDLRTKVLWPRGILRESRPARPWAFQRATRDEFRVILAASVPTALTSLLGRDASEEGAARIAEFIAIPALVRSLT
jgi:hypothetical protein